MSPVLSGSRFSRRSTTSTRSGRWSATRGLTLRRGRATEGRAPPSRPRRAPRRVRLPRDITGRELAALLSLYFDYEVVRQTGGHLRLATSMGGEHRVRSCGRTAPRRNPRGHLLRCRRTSGDHPSRPGSTTVRLNGANAPRSHPHQCISAPQYAGTVDIAGETDPATTSSLSPAQRGSDAPARQATDPLAQFAAPSEGGNAQSGHPSRLRSADKRPSVRWFRGCGPCRADRRARMRRVKPRYPFHVSTSTPP